MPLPRPEPRAKAPTSNLMENAVSETTYDAKKTGILLVDPFNDFLSEGGKLTALAKPVADEVNLMENLAKIIQAGRDLGIQIFFVPHHRWEKGDFNKWKYPNHTQVASAKRMTFAKGTWGGEFHPDFQPQEGDIIISDHFAQSGFANTNLDHSLKQHGIEKIIVIGMLANTCIESTARFGMELGFHVTLVKDATAAFSKEAMHAAHHVNGPTFAHNILTTGELLAALKAAPVATA
jgi:nicotinamidase-related amidase